MTLELVDNVAHTIDTPDSPNQGVRFPLEDRPAQRDDTVRGRHLNGMGMRHGRPSLDRTRSTTTASSAPCRNGLRSDAAVPYVRCSMSRPTVPIARRVTLAEWVMVSRTRARRRAPSAGVEKIRQAGPYAGAGEERARLHVRTFHHAQRPSPFRRMSRSHHSCFS